MIHYTVAASLQTDKLDQIKQPHPDPTIILNKWSPYGGLEDVEEGEWKPTEEEERHQTDQQLHFCVIFKIFIWSFIHDQKL